MCVCVCVRVRVCVCVRERAALTRRPRCQRPLAWMWHKRRLSDGPLCPEEAPRPALGQALTRSLTVVCWPMPWLRANRDHACSAPLLGEASLLCPKGFAATRMCRAVCVAFFLALFGGAGKGEMLPVLQIQRKQCCGGDRA